jgi:Protein of unknown function (DUF2510)
VTTAGPAEGCPDPERRLLAWRRTQWQKQVAARFAILVVAYLSWLGLYIILVSYHWGDASSGGPGAPATPPTTMYQGSPGLARTLLACVAAAFVIETASVLWRVARHSHRVGVTGLVVAIAGGAISLLGFMTIGIFIAPFAGLCTVLALPIGNGSQPGTAGNVPPGWYADPKGWRQWRYWDGYAWTSFLATTDEGVVTSPR